MNYKNEISLKKEKKNKSHNLKLISHHNYSKDKISVFLRSQYYFIYNLLSKKKTQKKDYPENIKFKFNNNNDLPSIKIKKIIKIGKNGFYSFKKIDYKYDYNHNLTKYSKDINNNSYNIINHRKSLIKNNSVNLIHKNKNIFDKLPRTKTINNPLIITHINAVKINNNKIKLKRNFSSKSVQKEEFKSINNDIDDKKMFFYDNYNTIYKKSEGTQINNNISNNKDTNIFFSGIKPNKMKIDYCSPKSIIFKKKKN